MHPNTITIDNVEYIRKDSVQEKPEGNYVIIRTRDAGVHAGYLNKKENGEVTLLNARRIWYWEGAATLSQMAMEGVKKPEKCKVPCPVAEITLHWIEIIPCTEKARNSIQSIPIWKC